MNILLDILPTKVEIDGEYYDIKSGFRESILFELLMQESKLSSNQKLFGALSIYYGDKVPHNLEEAVDKMLWFYRCGEELEPVKEDIPKEKQEPTTRQEQIYSFDADATYIYAAFLSQYGIDLQDIENLHWWKFKALFNSLAEDTKFVKIMEYRSMKINSDMSKEQKDFYRSMKRLYALPDNRTEEEKEADFHNALAKIV